MIEHRDNLCESTRNARPVAGGFHTSGPTGHVESVGGRPVVRDTPATPPAVRAEPPPPFTQDDVGLWTMRAPQGDARWTVRLHDDATIAGQRLPAGATIEVDAGALWSLVESGVRHTGVGSK